METKLLTYAELGEALGITPASAKRLAIRRGWAKTPGNDGKARVSVPIERLQIEKADPRDTTDDKPGDDTEDATSDDPSDDTSDRGDILGVVSALERHIARLEQELGEASTKLTSLVTERDQERAEKELERARAAQVDILKAVLEAEQRRSSELKDERDRWQQAATAPRGFWAWMKRAG